MTKINHTALPAPTAFSLAVKPITGAGARNTLGELMQDTLAFKREVTFVWRRLDQSTLSAMLELIEGQGEVTLTYPDPALGEITIPCACTARSMAMEAYGGGAPIWKDVTLTFEER